MSSKTITKSKNFSKIFKNQLEVFCFKFNFNFFFKKNLMFLYYIKTIKKFFYYGF